MFGRKNKNYQQYSYQPLYSSYPYEMHQTAGNQSTRTQAHYHPYYPQASPMYQEGPVPYGNQQSMMGDGGNYGHHNQTYPIEAILQNPLQPKKTQGAVGQGNPYMTNNYPYMHPYPKPGYGNRPPAGMNSILNSFKTQDGTFDFNKMIDTAGHMMNAFSQVSGLVKGIGGIFKV